MVFQKRLPNKIPFRCFTTSVKINYWDVKATGGYILFFSENRQIHLQRCKPQQLVQSTSPQDKNLKVVKKCFFPQKKMIFWVFYFILTRACEKISFLKPQFGQIMSTLQGAIRISTPQTWHISSLRISGRRGRYYCIFS